MAKEDVQLFSSLKFPAIATQLQPAVRRAFNSIEVRSPDGATLWVDIYKRPDRTVYFRVSFYVGWPPSGSLLEHGKQIATYLAVDTGINWVAYEANRRTRPTKSIKVVCEVDINLNEWPISRLAQLPRW